MALKEEIRYFISILEDGQIQVREDRVIFDNDVEITRLHHRHVIEPGQDLTSEPSDRARRIATMEWTPEVVKNYTEKKNKAIQ